MTFARIIGVGDKTVARYENGSIQDKAINNLILLAKDPKNFAVLCHKNDARITSDEAKRLEKLLGHVKVFAVWSNTQNDYSYNVGNQNEYEMSAC